MNRKVLEAKINSMRHALYRFFSVDQELAKKFISFLHEKNVYLQYMYNFMLRKIQKTNGNIIPCSDPIHFLNAAFIWSKTNEGYDFWYVLNQEWIHRMGDQ